MRIEEVSTTDTGQARPSIGFTFFPLRGRRRIIDGSVILDADVESIKIEIVVN